MKGHRIATSANALRQEIGVEIVVAFRCAKERSFAQRKATIAPRLILLLIVAALSSSSLISSTRAADDTDFDRVEKYLARLGLVDLQLQHLEDSLRQNPDAKIAEARAKRLADLYADRLLAASDDAARLQQLTQRVDDLRRRFPVAQTAALRVALLQAEYQRAESEMLRWLERADAATPAATTVAALEDLATKLTAAHRELDTVAKATAEQLNKADEAAAPALENELRRQQIVAARTIYFAGWSSYYAGVARRATSELSSPHFENAVRSFEELLAIEPNAAYAKLDAEQLSLDSPWRSRAAIGLGMTQQARGQREPAEQVWLWLASSPTPPTIRDQVQTWRVQGWINVTQWKGAADVAREVVSKFTDTATAGQVGLCVVLLRAGLSGAEAQRSVEQRQLAEFGAQGLARLRQFQLLRQLVEKDGLAIPASAGFHLLLAFGQAEFAKGEKSKEPAAFVAAAEKLNRALALPEARSDLAATARGREALAWCLYRQNDWPTAARQFRLAAEALKPFDAKTAAEMAWMSFVAYDQASKNEARATKGAAEALDFLLREFADSAFAKKAELQRSRLRQAQGSPAQAIAELERIAATDPNYAASRYEIALLRHKLWSDERTSAVKKRAALDAANAVLNLKEASDEAQRLRCVLIMAEISADDRGATVKPWVDALHSVKAFAERLPETSALRIEFHYRSLQAAQQTNDAKETRRHADWLRAHGRGSAFELPALIVLARGADDRVAAAATAADSAAERSAALKEGVEHYSRLVALLGDSPEALASRKNALIASSKLASYELELGQHAAAAERLDRLLAAAPQDKSLLRRSGLAHFHTGQLPKSLERWRAILPGLAKGSDDYFEAKYFQLACLQKTDLVTAKSAAAQFRLLYPNGATGAWREKMASLLRSLDGT